MKNKTRLLATAGLTALLLTSTAHRGFALGPGGAGGGINVEPYNITGLGPLDGEWDMSGGVSAFGAVLNNATPTINGGGPVNARASLGSIFLHLTKNSGIFQFHFLGGQLEAPTMGLTSDMGAFNSLAPYGSPANPQSPPAYHYFMTIAPSQYWSVSAGRLLPLEGIEGAIELQEPTFYLSTLSWMQPVSGYGGQLNLFYGPATLNVSFGDQAGNKRMNLVQAALTYNLNADGSDLIVLYGHEHVSSSGHPYKFFSVQGFGYNIGNDSLVGAGGQWIIGPWTIMPEAQYQWLPKDAVSLSSGEPRPLTTYYAASAMADVTYAINSVWSVTGQAEYVYQNGDKKDPNANLFGNWIQYGSFSAPGTYSAGTSMTGLQANVTWQHQNLFVRPTVAMTHISGYDPGTGYGADGRASNQFSGILEFGFLLGKYPS